MKRFFRIINSKNNNIIFKLEKPSSILLNNIYINWMQFINSKTYKHLPILLNNSSDNNIKEHIPFGFINHNIPDFMEHTELAYNTTDGTLKNKSRLNFNLVAPQQDIMQYFIQWQRYRKYWWSSITTTPSLFASNDIEYVDTKAKVNIVAQFTSGSQIVETITIDHKNTSKKNASCLSCSMVCEEALLILLLDGLLNSTKEDYLRLHMTMAPYKISFALDCEGTQQIETLHELTSLLHYKLKTKKIFTLLPDISQISQALEIQLQENLKMGVPYTAILSERTLSNGIFDLMNSSTMLKEQVHVGDFDKYAALICKK